MTNKRSFFIKHFDDYHEINSDEMYKAIELGCFPPKGNWSYFRYFGLFYTGRRPSFEKIFDVMKKYVAINKKFYFDILGEEVVTEERLKHDLKQALK